MYFALAAIFILAGLSIIGAFLGAEKAGKLFASVPLAVFWIGLVVLLAAGLARRRTLVRQPGPACVHLGCILILVGGLWGSEGAQRIRANTFGDVKVPKGYMLLVPGHAQSQVTEPDLVTGLGRLPFELELEKFRVERYPSDGQSWELVAALEDPRRTSEDTPWQGRVIDWEGDRETPIPCSDATVRVVRYAPDVPLQHAEGATVIPVVELELSWSGQTRRQWLVPYPGEQLVQLPLADVFADIPGAGGLPSLFLMKPIGQVKSYKSSLVVLEEGKPAAHRVIEVNKPLHYGGYHFYQYACDEEDETYTILMVVSDTGLAAVFAGFGLLVAGSVWRFWIRPAWKHLRRREA